MKIPISVFLNSLLLLLLLSSCKGVLFDKKAVASYPVATVGLFSRDEPKLGVKVMSLIENKSFLPDSHDVYSFSIKKDVLIPRSNTNGFGNVKYPYGVSESSFFLMGYDANCYFRFYSDGRVLWKFYPMEKDYISDAKFEELGFIDKSKFVYFIRKDRRTSDIYFYPKPLNGFGLEQQDHTLSSTYSGVYGIDNGKIVLEFIIHILEKPKVLTLLGEIEGDRLVIKKYTLNNSISMRPRKLRSIDISAKKIKIDNLPEVRPIYETIDGFQNKKSKMDKSQKDK